MTPYKKENAMHTTKTTLRRQAGWLATVLIALTGRVPRAESPDAALDSRAMNHEWG